MSQLTNAAENALTDWHRGQTLPSVAGGWDVAMFSTTCTEAGPGIEAAYSGYTRVNVPATLAAWSGTQGAATTAVSSGSSGASSNNSTVQFPAIGATPGPSLPYFGLFVGGTNFLWAYGTLAAPFVPVANSSGPFVSAGQLTRVID